MKALPEDRTIIERAVAEVNDSTAAFMRFFFNKTLRSAMGLCSCITLVSVASIACAGDEGAARRMGNEAVAAVKAQRLDEAIALYREVVDRYPDTAVALHARERITFLSGLSHSVVSFPSRTARDLMVETARAVQRYRYSKGRYPDNLDALMPKMLNEAPIDPWGSPLQYERLEGGYRLSCLGGDSRRGGEGIAMDFVIVNGNFVSDPALEAPF
ncbi:MAG: type II secretion system protein GspG [Acidobacteriota bacterium]